MGKKSKFKAIKRLAAQLPAMTVQSLVTTRLTGAEVLESGVTEVNGHRVWQHGTYIRKSREAVEVNHVEQMKKMYYKHKVAGVRGYVSAVKKRDEELTAADANH
jgi:hypothetical protein